MLDVFVILGFGFILAAGSVQAGSTNTWNQGAGNTDWNNAGSWTPSAVPTDVAAWPAVSGSTSANAPDLKGNSYTLKKMWNEQVSWNAPTWLNGNGPATCGAGILTLTADSPGDPGVGIRFTGNATFNCYANVRLGMANRTNEQQWVVGNSVNAAVVNMYGRLDGTGLLHLTNAPGAIGWGSLSYMNGYDATFAPFNGDTLLSMASLYIVDSNITGNTTFQFGTNTTGNATITFDTIPGVPRGNGSGSGNGPPGSGNAPANWFFGPISSATSAHDVTLQNDFVIRGMTGVLWGPKRGKSAVGGAVYPRVVYSGKLTLGGPLRIGVSDATITGASANDSSYDPTALVPFTNGVVIDQTLATRALFRTWRYGGPVTFPALFSDTATGSYRNPLIFDPETGTFVLNGTNSTYQWGTVVGPCDYSSVAASTYGSSVSAGSPGALGSGNVTLLPGGRIALTTTNVLANSQQVELQGNSVALSSISFSNTAALTILPTFATNSMGVILLSGTGSSAFNDLMANGKPDNVFLGGGGPGVAGNNSCVFTGTILRAGSDNVYRIGGGGQVLWGGSADLNGLILNSPLPNGVLTGAKDVQVNYPARDGSGNVFLYNTNDFTGKLTVYGGLLNPGPSIGRFGDSGGSKLAGSWSTTFTPGTSPFGSTNGALDLVGAQIEFDQTTYSSGIADAIIVKNATTFTSESWMDLYANTPANNIGFTLGTLTRNTNGVLVLIDGNSKLGGGHNVKVVNAGAELTTPVNGMVPPNYLVCNGINNYYFATYAATCGFTQAVFSANNLNTPSLATDLIDQAAVVLGGDSACYALRVKGAITAPSVQTITINSGGLILGANIGTAGANVNVDFGGSEAAIFNTTADSAIYGAIMNTGGKGVTKSGKYQLTMTNLNNTFTGPVTVNRGKLVYNPDLTNGITCGSLGQFGGSTTNGIVLNGGYMVANTPSGNGLQGILSAGRLITLGPLGGAFSGPNGLVSIQSKITGPGTLLLGNGYLQEYGIENPNNDYQGGTLVNGKRSVNDLPTRNYVSSTGKLGQGPVILWSDEYGAQLEISFYGNDNLHYTGLPAEKFLPLQVSAASTAYFACPAPVMGALTGDGDVVLGTTATNTVLTVGKDNTSATFYGFISEVSGQVGSVVKDGTGTWNLYGAQYYSGATTVTNGTLNLMGSLRSNCVVGANGTLTGLGLVGGSLAINGGTLAVPLSAGFVPLQVAGSLTIAANSHVNMTFANGYMPHGDTVLLQVSGTITGTSNLTAPSGYIIRTSGNSLLLRHPAGTASFFR